MCVIWIYVINIVEKNMIIYKIFGMDINYVLIYLYLLNCLKKILWLIIKIGND